jgi:hypothetical protein
MNRNVACFALVLACSSVCLADEPPDSKVNPQTGLIETVYSVTNGSLHGIRLTVDRDALASVTTAVADGTADELGPRIAIASTGDASVVWTEAGETAQVQVRTRSSSRWGEVRLVSDPDENSRSPEIVQADSFTWVVYQIDGTSTTSVAVSAIGDEPDPVRARTIVTDASSAGDIDARIQAEAGHVWVTWIDDGSQVGWSELDAEGSWTSPAYQDYSQSDIDSARVGIRQDVLGL